MRSAMKTLTRWISSCLIAFLTICGLLLSSSAWGQGACAPRAAMIERAKVEFGEVPVVAGLERGGLAMEVLASPEGSWTMLAVNPMGLACVVATGTAWRAADTGKGA